MSSSYDVAQICQNGHVINSLAQGYPTDNSDYCKDCGSKSITHCPNCQEPIRGSAIGRGTFGSNSPYPVPSYCQKCGKPYPWTESKQKALLELSNELGFAQLHKALTEDVLDLTAETPRSKAAAMRFKRLAEEAGKNTAGIFRDLMVDIAAESVKRIIYPDIK